MKLIDVRRRADAAQAFAADVLAGLSGRSKQIPSRWLYDEAGSRLFERITELPEYYLTRTEAEILERHAAAVASRLPRRLALVDLGAGDGRKTAILVRALLAHGVTLDLLPADLSKTALVRYSSSLGRRHGRLDVTALCGDYDDVLGHLAATHETPRCALFLGSSIGNFEPDERFAFLLRLRRILVPGELALIGFDLLKDPRLLTAAYDDGAGVTAAFTLNILKRLNRELATGLEPEAFCYHCAFNPERGCVEAFAITKRPQRVRLAGCDVELEAWEPIRTERAYKFGEAAIDRLAQAAGFRPVAALYDERRWFVDALWQAI